MNLRNAWNHARLHRVALVITIVASLIIILGIALITANEWLAPTALALLIGLAFLNARPFMQWVYESYGADQLHLNQPNKAEAFFRISLEWANSLAKDDPCRGHILELLSIAARKQGNYDDAEAFGRDWCDAEARTWGSDHPRTARAMEELARNYDRMAQYHLAKPWLEKALLIRQAHQQNQPTEYAQFLDLFGSHWCRLDRYDLAEPYFRKALGVVRQLLDSPPQRQLAFARNLSFAFGLATGIVRLEWAEIVIARNLSLVCVHLDKLDEADELAQSALWVASQHCVFLGFFLAADCSGQLALVRRHQERFEEAEELAKRAIKLKETEIGDNPLVLHEELLLLGVIHRHQSRWADAEECFREVLRLRQDYCAPEDLSIARVLEDYAELLELMGRMDEAQTHQNHAKQIRDFHSPFRLI